MKIEVGCLVSLKVTMRDARGALLEQSGEVIAPGGRLAVITFHSIEDRMVKQFLRGELDGAAVPDPVFGTRREPAFMQESRKPVEPSAEEIKRNPRSRSARLRVGIKR
jgi:16S rRNA (cytosine1402-N4)-methyltransferase